MCRFREHVTGTAVSHHIRLRINTLGSSTPRDTECRRATISKPLRIKKDSAVLLTCDVSSMYLRSVAS